MMRSFVVLAAVLTLLPATAFACSCFGGSKWSQGVADGPGAVARVKVESQSGSGFDQRTIVRVLRVFRGEVTESKLTVVLVSSCSNGVGRTAVGKEFVWHFLPTEEPGEVMLRHCGLPSLPIIDGRISVSAKQSDRDDLLLDDDEFAAWLPRPKPRESSAPLP